MKQKIILFLTLLPFLSGMQAQSLFFPQADAFFKENVTSNGKVDYASIKANPKLLNSLVTQIGKYQPEGKSKSEQKAFWINAYNILVIKNVVGHYPVSSPLKVDGFFDKKRFNIAGTSLTLSDIENKIIRPQFNDPRIHFVLVCAALSCPPLANYAYQPSTLNSQLEQRTRKALNSPDFIRVSPNGKVLISKIFEWYETDFTDGGKTIAEYINQYRTQKIKSQSPGFYAYDWTLNEKK